MHARNVAFDMCLSCAVIIAVCPKKLSAFFQKDCLTWSLDDVWLSAASIPLLSCSGVSFPVIMRYVAAWNGEMDAEQCRVALSRGPLEITWGAGLLFRLWSLHFGDEDPKLGRVFGDSLSVQKNMIDR